jgi:membrane-associated phospholipid phosphatase
VTVWVNLLFWAGYGILGRSAVFPIRAVPLTPLDEAVAFTPEPWGWIYFSAYIYSAVLPWLLTSREHIRRYAAGIACMALISFTIYFFFPTPSPRPSDVGESLPMQLIANLDGPYNAFPSLHAGFILFMGLLAWRMFGRIAPRFTLACAIPWGTAVFYSTLATKQHYVLDLIAGALIGILADAFAWRRGTANPLIPKPALGKRETNSRDPA